MERVQKQQSRIYRMVELAEWMLVRRPTSATGIGGSYADNVGCIGAAGMSPFLNSIIDTSDAV